MKKIISLVLSVVMLFSVTAGLNISAYADELPASGSCGENVTYTFDSETGALTISGTGYMTDYEYTNQCHYHILGENITYDAIGNPTSYLGYTMNWTGRELNGITGNGINAQYKYDSEGLRSYKRVHIWFLG